MPINLKTPFNWTLIEVTAYHCERLDRPLATVTNMEDTFGEAKR